MTRLTTGGAVGAFVREGRRNGPRPRGIYHYAGPDAVHPHIGRIEDCPRRACRRIVARARRAG